MPRLTIPKMVPVLGALVVVLGAGPVAPAERAGRAGSGAAAANELALDLGDGTSMKLAQGAGEKGRKVG